MASTNSFAAEVNPLHIELDTKSYSNICKRLAAHLLDQHDVTLSHTQVRTAVSNALGFDSPNVLDSLLREDETTKKSSAKNAKLGPRSDTPDGEKEQQDRIEREQQLRLLLKEPIARDVQDTAGDLLNLTLSLLAQRFPAKLSPSDKTAIKRIYPAATDTLISERAMSREGVVTTLAMATQSGKIALDYYAPSDSTRAQKGDEQMGPTVGAALGGELDKAFKGAVSRGFSPYGAATTVILTGSLMGLKEGVHWAWLVRSLLDSVTLVLENSSFAEIPAEVEEQAIKSLMAQMGISRAEAKKYAAHAKKLMRGGVAE